MIVAVCYRPGFDAQSCPQDSRCTLALLLMHARSESLSAPLHSFCLLVRNIAWRVVTSFHIYLHDCSCVCRVEDDER